ncbi:hypothetical protein B0H13DRAFT_1913531 [Mycena leptocephala]|nr:hypothetical protein B0H13DRAFT_1913531 [Mycena leptocephala]
MRVDDQLLSSILLGSVSLIPNNSLRYTALGSAVAFALVYNLLPERATRIRQLEHIIQQTEEGFGRAKSKVKRSSSKMHCCLLEGKRLTWKQYWDLNKRVAECTTSVNNIRTAVQACLFIMLHLIVEAELQRKLTEDINEKHSILANACTACQVNQHNLSDKYVCADQSSVQRRSSISGDATAKVTVTADHPVSITNTVNCLRWIRSWRRIYLRSASSPGCGQDTSEGAGGRTSRSFFWVALSRIGPVSLDGFELALELCAGLSLLQ